MTERDAFLRAIAANPDIDAPRLIFSDWLDENADPDRAEFIRTQCELAHSSLAEDRRHSLRLRERELLDAHRRKWIEQVGLPVEDVSFERGFISKVRLATWKGFRLDPALAALKELDLSGLQLGDAGVAEFARTAAMPALSKLILSDNGITDGGAAALASATGLPSLDTLYLFGNAINANARVALEQSDGFRLANLDFGERTEGYTMSPGEAEIARRHYLRTELLPLVSQYFTTYERLQSAALCVAQYWDDEANDAVHGLLVVSELFEPILEGITEWSEESRSDPNIPNTRINRANEWESGSVVGLYSAGVRWDDNTDAIPLWAAFAPEEGSQEYEFISEVYLPAVMFYRHGGYDMLSMSRPQLNGIQPEWSREEE